MGPPICSFNATEMLGTIYQGLALGDDHWLLAGEQGGRDVNKNWRSETRA